MPTAHTNEALFTLIERSGLLARPQLAAYRDSDASDNALELMRALVHDRLLTPYQARQLLRGNYRGFFLTEKYKVLDRLGEGGMGHVLLCEHMLLQKLVAVKLLSASWLHVPGAEQRFMREARAAAALDHPNVVRVFDADRAAGVPFMVMEYVDGKTLHQLVAAYGPLSPMRAAEYIRQAAIGLYSAYRVGLVHRDIKPGNLLLDRSGVVKILDLGLARFLVDSARNHNLTEQFDPGTVLGTVDFIAPEQADNSSKVDIRADVYSLGYTLYFLLTGKTPFGEGSAAQKLMWHQVREPVPLAQHRSDIPPEFQEIFERMTRKNPLDRYQNPAEVVAAITPLVTGPVPPPPASQMPKIRPTEFLLGFSPPPTPEMITGADIDDTTPPVLSSLTTQVTSVHGSNNFGSDEFRLTPTGSAEPLEASSAPPPTSVESAAIPPSPRYLWPLTVGVAVVLAVVVGIAAWQLSKPAKKDVEYRPIDNSQPTPPTPPPPVIPAGVVLTGEGSSFVDPMMQRWAELYKQKTGVTIRYAKTGSSAGVREFTSKRVLFGGTDAFLTDEQLLDAQSVGGPVVHIPLVMGAVVVTYNLPMLNEPLKFTGGVLADIYLGKITKWDHPAIAACNRGVKLPSLDIVVVHRSDGSGTTFIWTDYLNKVSGAWKKPMGPGVGNVVKWPVGVPADKNDGVAREVSKQVGTIGYVELNYALAQNLPVGRVENQNLEYVTPSLASVTAAAAGKMKDVSPDLRFTLTDVPGKNAYPIAGTTWAIVFRKQVRENKQLADFLHWIIHDGQAEVTELKYAPLPPELVKRIDALLAEP